MAKAVVASMRPDGSWFVSTIYPDGTDLTKVASPTSGQLLLRWRDAEPGVGQNIEADAICNGLAVIISTISTINWTQVKAAIN